MRGALRGGGRTGLWRPSSLESALETRAIDVRDVQDEGGMEPEAHAVRGLLGAFALATVWKRRDHVLTQGGQAISPFLR